MPHLYKYQFIDTFGLSLFILLSNIRASIGKQLLKGIRASAFVGNDKGYLIQ